MTDETIHMPDETPNTAAEGEAAQENPPQTMRTEDAMAFAIGLFADLAWINMGIRSNPATGATTTDLAQARLAIDAINALVPLTEGRFDAHQVRDFRNMLSTLQLNYVQRLPSRE